MKREICCLKCSAKLDAIRSDLQKTLTGAELQEFQNERVVKKLGTAREEFRCDVCDCRIAEGTTCVAVSMMGVTQHDHYYEWESEFILNIEVNG